MAIVIFSQLLGEWLPGHSKALLHLLCVPHGTRKRAEDPEGDL